MIHQTHVTVAEAAVLTGKSKSLIWRHIRHGRLRSEETSTGLRLRTADVLTFFANRKPGRPRHDTPTTPGT